MREALRQMERTITTHEDELARIDAVAGDGDHGRGMLKGIRAATAEADAVPETAGPAHLLRRAGGAWAEHVGGTSGVLWGAGLEAFGGALGDDREFYGATEVGAAVRAFTDAIADLGRAEVGDKTMLDALVPFAEAMDGADDGRPLVESWSAAAERATAAADATRELRPRLGRARPLAEKSLGHPDAGATSLALLVTDLGEWPAATPATEGA